jgi:hypothetical protein
VQAKSRLTASILSGRRPAPEEPISITVRTMANRVMQFDDLYPSTTIKDIKTLIETQHNVPTALQRLDLLGKPLSDQKTFEQCDIMNGTAVNLTLISRTSMIYLSERSRILVNGNWQNTPNGTQNIEVQLSMNRAWELSIVLPSVKKNSNDFIQSVSWTLDAKPSGLLHDHDTGIDISYLFWDDL